MPKKKRFKLKLSKKDRKKLASIAIPLSAGLFGLMIGVVSTKYLINRQNPTNLIWSADNSVKIPRDLSKFLATKKDCKAFRGPNSPDGIGLWGVYQVSKDQFAKIAYGCSWNLSSYIMAVEQNGKWELIKPTDYFAPFKNGVDQSQGALPNCSIVEKYNIPSDIEPFCINSDGSVLSNSRK